MSNSLAITAATAALHNLLAQVKTQLPEDPDNELGDTDISMVAPDKVSNDESVSHLNIFLYQVLPNAALRNLDTRAIANAALRRSDVQAGLPERAGESGPPPLALNLHYLITVHGRQGSELLAQRLLCRTMGVLHANSVLSPTLIAAAQPGNTLHQQIERIRISPMSIATEEMSRLWTMFQAKYRLSVAYQVSVVLIDSGLPVSSAAVGPRVNVNVNPQPNAPSQDGNG